MVFLLKEEPRMALKAFAGWNNVLAFSPGLEKTKAKARQKNKQKNKLVHFKCKRHVTDLPDPFFFLVVFCFGLFCRCSLLALYQMDVQNKSQGLIAAEFRLSVWCTQLVCRLPHRKPFVVLQSSGLKIKPMSWCYRRTTPWNQILPMRTK